MAAFSMSQAQNEIVREILQNAQTADPEENIIDVRARIWFEQLEEPKITSAYNMSRDLLVKYNRCNGLNLFYKKMLTDNNINIETGQPFTSSGGASRKKAKRKKTRKKRTKKRRRKTHR